MSALDIFRGITFGVVLLVALYYSLNAILRLYRVLQKGQKDPERWGHWGKRTNLVLVNVFGQKKLLRHRAGIGHLVIFYGFIFVTIVSMGVFVRAFFPLFSFSFLGPGYPVLIWTEQILAIGVLIAVAVGMIRRYVVKPLRFTERLEQAKGLNRDATIILLVVALHLIFSFTLESLEIYSGTQPAIGPVSTWMSTWWSGDVTVFTEIVWWLHAFSVWGFLVYIFATNVRVPKYYPSKHFHILSAVINVFFGNTMPSGRLKPMVAKMDDFEDVMTAAMEGEGSFGLNKVDDLRWPEMLDLYSCTGCGRCQEVCPAFLADQPLSPRALILNMREQLLEKASLGWDGVEMEKQLIGDIVPPETFWSCTTCNACVTACPVFIEHIPPIIDMRRYVGLMEAEYPDGMEKVFTNIENNSNPWGIGKALRDEWAKDLDLKLMKDHPDTPTLFWVGCAGSFDDHAKKVSTGLVKILQAAGVDFAILGKEENCTGDPARRAGNEYLAMDLMTQNVELLNSYQFKEVITACPHCFNNLANELPDFGGHYKVIHAVEYVNRLIKEGKIKLDTTVPLNLTYHDSCYLGRHNGIYDAPREILSNFDGVTVVEMEMNKDMAMCCGAGGARMWYEMKGQKDINKNRVAMAERTGADVIGVSCPFCSVMLEDGVKNTGSEMAVLDLIELVNERMKS